MRRFLKLEWKVIRAKGAWKTLLYLTGVYLILFIGMSVYLKREGLMRFGFFPVLAAFLPVAASLSLFENETVRPLHRLLPSLPFTRSQIYLGLTCVKIMTWAAGLPAVVLISIALNPWLRSAPTLPIFLLGTGLSFFYLSLEHLTLHFSYRVQTGLTGALLGGLASSGDMLFRSLLEVNPGGERYLLMFLCAGILLFFVNKIIYERRAL